MADNDPAQSVIDSSDEEGGEATPSAVFDLRYPQLMLKASFDSLLTHSRVSEPPATPDKIMDQPRKRKSGIQDSWTKLDQSTHEQDDDSESLHTDVESLVDIQSTSDIQSLYDDEGSNEDMSESGDEEEAHAGESCDNMVVSHEDLVRSSQITIKDSATEAHSIRKTLTAEHFMDSPCRTYKIYRKVIEELPTNVTSTSPAAQTRVTGQMPLQGTIRIPMSRTSSSVYNKHIRNLIIFEPMHDAETRQKLVKALSAALGSKKVNVQFYDFARKVVDGRLSGQTILLQNTEEFSAIFSQKRGDSFALTGEGWTSPDLAVLVTGGNLAEFDESKDNMIDLLQRHEIPYLLITHDQGGWYDSPSVDQPSHALQRCIESIEDRSSGWQVVKGLPVDLDNFVRIDAHHLRSHITFLVLGTEDDHQLPQENDIKASTANPRRDMSAWKDITSSLRQMFYVLLPAIILAFMFSFVMTSVHLYKSHYAPLTISAGPPYQSRLCSPVNTETRVATSRPRTAITSLDDMYARLLDSALTTLSTKPKHTADHRSSISTSTNQEYQVEVVGYRQAVIKLHGSLRRRLHNENFSIAAQRSNSGPVNIGIERPIAGTYVVQFDSEEAYGNIILTLRFDNHEPLGVVPISFGSDGLEWKMKKDELSGDVPINPDSKELDLEMKKQSIGYRIRLVLSVVQSIVSGQVAQVKQNWSFSHQMAQLKKKFRSSNKFEGMTQDAKELLRSARHRLNHIQLTQGLQQRHRTNDPVDDTWTDMLAAVSHHYRQVLGQVARNARANTIHVLHGCNDRMTDALNQTLYRLHWLGHKGYPQAIDQVQKASKSKLLATAQNRAFRIVKTILDKIAA